MFVFLCLKTYSRTPHSYNWGIVQNQRMKLKPALRAFKAFCRLFPDNERGWYMMAQVARNMDDVEEIVSANHRLFQLNPNHGEGYGQLCDALSDLKYYLPAISTLRKALEIRRREPVRISNNKTVTGAHHVLAGF